LLWFTGIDDKQESFFIRVWNGAGSLTASATKGTDFGDFPSASFEIFRRQFYPRHTILDVGERL
jgi:hypothetical protein